MPVLGCGHGRAKVPPCRETGVKAYPEAAVQGPAGTPRARYQSAELSRDCSRMRRNADVKHCAASPNVDLRRGGLRPRGLLVEIVA